MKTKYTIIAIILSLYCYAQKTDTLIINAGEILGNRSVLIYTPKNYEHEPTKKFEVVYVLDAQDRDYFDYVCYTINIQNYGICPMIVIGIISENRNKDFLPANEYAETFEALIGQLGNADYFQDFIEYKLVPYVDSAYRTLPTKIIVGYSNGGTFISNLLLKEPNLFNAYLSIDANFSYDKGQLISKIKNKSSTDKNLGLTSDIFYFNCSSVRGEVWNNNNKKFNSYLKLSDKIIYRENNFNNETHQTVSQIGILTAFKEYFKYQFFDAEHLINYYKSLRLSMPTNDILSIAATYNNSNLTEEANKLINYYKNSLSNVNPNSMSIYDLFEVANLFYDMRQSELALTYFNYCDKKLDEIKPTISKEDYSFGKKLAEDKIKLIKSSNN
ncbi:MAG: hypothetical protein KF900_02340 [Bacteroidetes bacterium]|nr:hypothetical protein [Bacteroidota bacterium]